IELFVANDSVSNFFFRSQQEGGQALRFADDGPISGVAMNARGTAEACMGTAVGDVDANGNLDLYVTNFYQESNTLYLQDDRGQFVDATQAAGLRDPSIFALGFGTQFVDAELDGLPDLIVSNGHISNFRSLGSPYRMAPQYYRNVGNGRFVELAGSTLGEYFEGAYLGRAVAVLDWNKDGREDVVIGHLDVPVALLTNTTQSAGNYLAVNLCGTESARDATGAILRLTVEGRTRTHQLTAGGGYHASNEPRLVFGLGKLDRVETLVVRWPSGNQQTFSNVPTNAELIVVENRSIPIILNTP
ncbi:MAG: CRTAC1 family protein, partial [Pirellulales bacterium]